MGLSGKLVSQMRIKSDGNAFYELFRYNPNAISEICPDKVQGVDLLSGQWGTLGSVVCWRFAVDGQAYNSKEIIESIDEKNKTITWNAIEGDMRKAYKTFKFIVGVDDGDRDNCMVTWTLEYEKENQAVSDPHAVMNCCLNITKDIERNHMLVPVPN